MNERLQRNGRIKIVDVGYGVEDRREGYDILSSDMRTTITSVFGISAAIQELENIVRMERTACSAGSCED